MKNIDNAINITLRVIIRGVMALALHHQLAINPTNETLYAKSASFRIILREFIET